MGDSSGFKPLPSGYMTKAIHVGNDPEQWSCLSIVPPISMSVTFKQHGPGECKKYEYGRTGNPCRDLLEATIAALDGGKYAMLYASGLGAITGILSILDKGDHIVSGDDLYGGSNRCISKVFAKFGVTSTFVDTTDLKNVETAIQPNTKLVWIENPTNPTMKVTDLEKLAELCKNRNIISVVDNSFLTSYFVRPLEYGIDVVMYSVTKYMNGHLDLLMGAAVTSNDDIHTKLRYLQNAMGVVPSPFDCALVTRSLKTLGLRMRQHSSNGLAVSKYLENHPKILKVLNPALPSHPQHEIFKKQCSANSGQIAVYLNGGLEDAKKFLKALKVFTLANSLGGCQSLVALPFVMSHASVPQEEREKLNITENLIRISVGLEDEEDLLADLEQALEQI